MTWNEELTELRNLLANLYPLREDMLRVIEEAALPTSQINLTGKPLNAWHEILRYAHNRNQVDAILKIAHREFPNKFETPNSPETIKLQKLDNDQRLLNELPLKIDNQLVGEARKLIGANKVEQSLDLLLKAKLPQPLYDYLQILKQQWLEISNNNIKGLLTEESTRVARAKVVNSLLKIISKNSKP